MYGKTVEEDRGQCECYCSLRKLQKIIRIWAASNQLTDEEEGESMLGVTVNLLMCVREDALYSVLHLSLKVSLHKSVTL
jgi:hypothetical protein